MKKTVIATLLLIAVGASWFLGRESGPPAPAESGAMVGVEDSVREAVDRLRAEIAESPGDAGLRLDLGMLYQVNGLTDAVETAYLHGLELAPEDAKCWYMLALHRSEQADLEGALEACRNAIRFDPSYVAARRKLGDLLLDLGRSEEALGAFQQALQDEPDHAANRVGLARAHLRLHEWEKAAKLLEQVIATQNGYGYASMLLGRAYLGLGQKEKARIASSRGTGDVPPLFDPWAQELQTRRIGYAGTMAKATQLFRERNNEGAIRVLSKLREQYPDDELLLNNLASAYSRTDQIDKMLEALQRAAEGHPDSYSTHLNLSYAYSAKADPARALEHARRAVELRPSQGPAHSQLCNIYAEMGDYEMARASIEAAIEIQGDKQALRMRLGKLLHEMEEFEDAVECFKGLTDLYPSSIKGFQWLARSLVAAGRPEEAATALAAAQRINSSHRVNSEIEQLLLEQTERSVGTDSASGAVD